MIRMCSDSDQKGEIGQALEWIPVLTGTSTVSEPAGPELLVTLHSSAIDLASSRKGIDTL
jgi:hypothetical protein